MDDLLALGLPFSLFKEAVFKLELLLHCLARKIDSQLVLVRAFVDAPDRVDELFLDRRLLGCHGGRLGVKAEWQTLPEYRVWFIYRVEVYTKAMI